MEPLAIHARGPRGRTTDESSDRLRSLCEIPSIGNKRGDAEWLASGLSNMIKKLAHQDNFFPNAPQPANFSRFRRIVVSTI